MEKITVSLIKADVGGFPGHSAVHPELMEQAKKDGLMYYVLLQRDDKR